MTRFNLLKTIFMMTFLSCALINPILSCSVDSSFVFPTIEEQTEKASAVVRGIVKRVKSQEGGSNATVILKKAKFIKGCGAKRVVISNFSADGLCGSGIPSVGDEIMVFLCPKKKETKKKTKILEC